MNAQLQEAVQPETIRPETIEAVQASVVAHPKLTISGGGTKPALSAPRPPAAHLSTTRLSGMLEYEPAEYTFTALAGTPLTEIVDTLRSHGQFLPFDPILAQAGATLGGTIAAGLSGSGRQRFGSLRDFLVGVRFVDGQGRLVRGGGKVVKNAAGFDLPKLMVGSLGKFGVLVEAGFKVFPEPPAYGTLLRSCPTFAEACTLIARLGRSQFDLYALDLDYGMDPQSGAPPSYRLAVRIGGLADTIPARLSLLQSAAQGGDLYQEDDDAQFWAARRALAWASTAETLVKSAVTLESAARLEQLLNQSAGPITRLYTAGVSSVWLASTQDASPIHVLLEQAGLRGLVIRDTGDHSPYAGPYIGRAVENVFLTRICRVLDPQTRFSP